MTEIEDVPLIIKLVNENDINEVETAVLKGEKMDAVDSSGMTALQHAAYKGQTDMCKLLLKYGADVNSDMHDHRYSALHFAALSGKVDSVKSLLHAGAHTHHTNSLGRTAAQMAGFVGNHEAVALINNYVPLEELNYYTNIHGLETEPNLKTALLNPLYDLLMQGNLHPVSHAIRVCCDALLLEHLLPCSKVLGMMCEKEAKSSDAVNEVICLKFHYLSFVLKTFSKELQKDAEKKSIEKLKELDLNTSKNDTAKLNENERSEKLSLEPLIRRWLKATPSGAEPYQDSFIRDAIKSFPYTEFPLFLQVVRNLSGGNEALFILTGSINGQRGFHDNVACCTCGSETNVSKKCSKCKCVQYCNRLCQRLHWGTHKRECDKLMKSAKAKLAEKKSDNRPASTEMIANQKQSEGGDKA